MTTLRPVGRPPGGVVRGFTRFAVAALAAGLVAACSGDGGRDVGAIEPTSEPTTDAGVEPTEPEDPYAIPDEIDVAYVQSVTDEVLAVGRAPVLEAFRTGPHSFPPDDLMAAIRAMYSPQLTVELLSHYAGQLSDAQLVAERLDELENQTATGWTVRELERADEDCIIVAFDYPEGGAEEGGRAVLLAGYDERDVEDLNPTPWVLDRNGPRSLFTEGELEERCTVDQQAEIDRMDDGSDQAPEASP